MSSSNYRISKHQVLDHQTLEQNTKRAEDTRSRIISTVLSPAMRLWLRSQLEAAEKLQFHITGGDRQILSGYIPGVTIAAEQVVYRGIAISQISAVGEEIRVNLREVLRGKPLRLVDKVPVHAEAQLTESDLNASLQTPLLFDALTDLLLRWLQFSRLDGLPEPLDRVLQDQSVKLHSLQIHIRAAQLVLAGTLSSGKQQVPFIFATGLQVVDGTRLRLDRPQLEHLQASQSKELSHLHGFEINLGSEVNIQQLTLQDGRILCQGMITVLP